MQKTNTLPKKKKSHYSSNPNILLTKLHYKNKISFLNKPITINIHKSKKKIHIKLNIITHYKK